MSCLVWIGQLVVAVFPLSFCLRLSIIIIGPYFDYLICFYISICLFDSVLTLYVMRIASGNVRASFEY